MKLIIAVLCTLISSHVFAAPAAVSRDEQILIEKGFVVLCSKTLGVMQAEDIEGDLNKKIQSIKTNFTVSQPSLALSLINVIETKSTDPGALAILCVTLTKKK